MSLSRTSRTAVAIAAGSTMLGAGTLAYASSARVTATATDVVTVLKSYPLLPDQGGAAATVLSVALPSGGWVLSITGDVVNFAPSDYVRCNITIGAKVVSSVTMTVGNPSTGVGPATRVAPFALTGGVRLHAPARVRLRCSHDTTNGATPYLDAGTALYAHKTSSLQVVSG